MINKKMDPNNTALLVFSLSAKKEVVRKPIGDGHRPEEQEALFNLLIANTRNLAAQCGVDFYWVDEHEQIGDNFSSRFTNAFQKLFDAGYDNVISIGNDSPDLTTQLLQDAVHKLESNKMVLGPSKDGGVYLIGLSKEIFHHGTFLNFRWQTSFLLDSLKDHIDTHKIDVEILRELSDIDSRKDLEHYAKSNPTSLLSKLFKLLIASLNRKWKRTLEAVPLALHLSNVGLRAPPVFNSF